MKASLYDLWLYPLSLWRGGDFWGLVTQEVVEGEKGILKISPSMELNFVCLNESIWTQTTDGQFSLFSLKSRTFGLGQTNSGAFGVFLAKLSAPILVQWGPCPCFPLFNHYFYKKISLYWIHFISFYICDRCWLAKK